MGKKDTWSPISRHPISDMENRNGLVNKNMLHPRMANGIEYVMKDPGDGVFQFVESDFGYLGCYTCREPERFLNSFIQQLY